MEPKHFLAFGLILIPYVLSERQCTESGQRIVNDHIENVVDEVCTLYQICITVQGVPHCVKSHIFVQKLNFDEILKIIFI